MIGLDFGAQVLDSWPKIAGMEEKNQAEKYGSANSNGQSITLSSQEKFFQRERTLEMCYLYL